MKLDILIKTAQSVLGRGISSEITDNKFHVQGLVQAKGPTGDDQHGYISSIGYHGDDGKKTNLMEVNHASVNSGMRGRGLARKMYGNLAHDAKQKGFKFLTSDSQGRTSSQAHGVWKRLKERGYPVHEIKHKTNAPHPVYGRATYVMNLNKLKDGRTPKK